MWACALGDIASSGIWEIDGVWGASHSDGMFSSRNCAPAQAPRQTITEGTGEKWAESCARSCTLENRRRQRPIHAA
jgi:hypothetical protein